MSLDDYQRNGWIQQAEVRPQELQQLMEVVERDIGQCQVAGLGAEWRFDIAYNAALQMAVVALGSRGFRAERVNKHQRSIECLEFTLGLGKREVDFLDRCRRKRHVAVYERVDAVSDAEADELTAFVKKLRDRVRKSLKLS